MSQARVRLAARGGAVARDRHPWIFSGAVGEVVGEPKAGDVVDVVSPEGRFAGRGLYNPHSQIRVRVYTWADEPLDDAFFAARVREAIALRRDILGFDDPRGARRLVFSEGDGLSGLTVDRYASWLVVQITGLGIRERLEGILDALEAGVPGADGVLLRTARGIADDEGLVLRDGVLRGRPPEAQVEIVEGPLRFLVDLRTGQKTGFYLDQSVNRVRAAVYARARAVADVCCYSGAFGVAAARAEASSVTAVDVSAPGLALARANAERNGVADRFVTTRADAAQWLAGQAEAGQLFDMIVLDPPSYARSRRGVPAALRAYQRLNRLALDALSPGGVLVTFCCSGRVSEGDFSAALGRAAAESGRSVRILERLQQAPDHVVSAACPQGAYLKGLVCVTE